MIWTLSLSNTSRLIHVSEPRRLLHQPVSADWHLPGGLWSSFQSSLQFHRSYHSQHGWSCNVRGSWAARGDADGGEKKTSHTVLKSCDNGVKQYFTSMLSGNRKREDTWSVSIISLSLPVFLTLCRSAAGAYRHCAEITFHVGFRPLSDGGGRSPWCCLCGGAGRPLSSLRLSAAEYGSRSDKLAEPRVEVRPNTAVAHRCCACYRLFSFNLLCPS